MGRVLSLLLSLALAVAAGCTPGRPLPRVTSPDGTWTEVDRARLSAADVPPAIANAMPYVARDLAR